MIVGKRSCNPVRYDMCNQTVTVYHMAGEQYTREVYDHAFLDYRKNLTVEKTGSKTANSFLLVIPGDKQAVFVGDKVVEGVGPEISDREAWAKFTPANVQGLVVVSFVDVKKWDNRIVHTEAGG